MTNFTTASASNNRTWTWKCDGQAGTAQKSCTAYKKINGSCSSAYNGITT
ncbi:MAG: hypothetical protein LBI53_02160 [Candidatus Peribacteria bacterium]|nr:hypothetical protein [Candidatus Peribacteria bacterium]